MTCVEMRSNWGADLRHVVRESFETLKGLGVLMYEGALVLRGLGRGCLCLLGPCWPDRRKVTSKDQSSGHGR